MRFAIFSDVHGNLPALEAVLGDMTQRRVTHTACLGDVVDGVGSGSGSLGRYSPRECLEIVRGMGCPYVKGNHEMDLLDHWDEDLGASRTSRRRTALTVEQCDFIQSLPLVRKVHNFTIVHSSLHEPEEWNYIHSQEAARRSFSHQETALCFHGHTHVPTLFTNSSPIEELSFTTFQLEPGKQYLVNVGSVGNPRDDDDRSAYVIYDTETNMIELIRV